MAFLLIINCILPTTILDKTTIGSGLEMVPGKITTVTSRLETIAGELEMVAGELEMVPGKITTVTSRLETIAGELEMVAETIIINIRKTTGDTEVTLINKKKKQNEHGKKVWTAREKVWPA